MQVRDFRAARPSSVWNARPRRGAIPLLLRRDLVPPLRGGKREPPSRSHIAATADVARYRAKIEGAIE
jgi:hypothetical protein